MVTTDILRNSIQPLSFSSPMDSQQTTLAFGGNDSNAYHMVGGGIGMQGQAPMYSPLFVNTSMTAGQRIDLYRRLCEPPCDAEPTLQLRLN